MQGLFRRVPSGTARIGPSGLKGRTRRAGPGSRQCPGLDAGGETPTLTTGRSSVRVTTIPGTRHR